MTAPRVSDHALIRFLERAGGFDVEQLRLSIGHSLTRAMLVCDKIGTSDAVITVDGLRYVVTNGVVVTVLLAEMQPTNPHHK